MFKDVLQNADLSDLSHAGLILFFLTFIAIAVWALTRPRRQVRKWSRLPLDEGNEGASR